MERYRKKLVEADDIFISKHTNDLKSVIKKFSDDMENNGADAGDIILSVIFATGEVHGLKSKKTVASLVSGLLKDATKTSLR